MNGQHTKQSANALSQPLLQSGSETMLDTALVTIQGLKKSYWLRPVLRRIDITVAAGQCLALLGANGTGKTTLLRILAGLAKPDAGTIQIAGLDRAHEALEMRRQIGFVAHQPYLYEELSVLENLLFFGRLYRVEHAREQVLSLVQRLDLDRKMHDRVRALSRGQVQRVAWARALLHQPAVLLLDEPDTGMDQEGNALIAQLLWEHQQRGGCTLFTTHQLEHALHWGDEVIFLAHGRISSRHQTADLTLAQLQACYQEVMR
ncbi:MAG TPA: heme ABC exporter ATP-binding protein CcmA [Dictyobacter sp.]|jgi:heme ABC exporter ATP-binding subunit CcmA|nr:heme ABC exporter ATP-binding protein CcmA [Dictyobacter sp.]